MQYFLNRLNIYDLWLITKTINCYRKTRTHYLTFVWIMPWRCRRKSCTIFWISNWNIKFISKFQFYSLKLVRKKYNLIGLHSLYLLFQTHLGTSWLRSFSVQLSIFLFFFLLAINLSHIRCLNTSFLMINWMCL